MSATETAGPAVDGPAVDGPAVDGPVAVTLPCAVHGVCPTPGACCAQPALVLQGVSAGYGRRGAIVHDPDLEVPEGACYAILGPSGCGKTTLLRLVLGMLDPRSGTIDRPALRQRGRTGEIGYIPQNLGLVRHQTVLQNVLLGALSRLPWYRSVFGRFPADELRSAEEALDAVGLGGRGDERIHTLSGGERRRVAIARAILQRPRILLADEFLAELDTQTAQEIVALLQSLRRRYDLTIVFVEHNVETACSIADRVVVLVSGRKVVELVPSDASTATIRELFRASKVA
jgi:phosphonate transport system ATP-binding protein